MVWTLHVHFVSKLLMMLTTKGRRNQAKHFDSTKTSLHEHTITLKTVYVVLPTLFLNTDKLQGMGIAYPTKCYQSNIKVIQIDPLYLGRKV